MTNTQSNRQYGNFSSFDFSSDICNEEDEKSESIHADNNPTSKTDKVISSKISFEYLFKAYYSENDLVENISDGVLLKGIRLSNLAHLINTSEAPVRIKKKLKFSFPWKAPLRHSIDFRQPENIDAFERKMTKFGISNASVWLSTLPTYDWRFILQPRIYRVTYNPISSASWQPSLDDFSLSDSAIQHLKEIEVCLLKKEISTAETLCETFFDTFGSHVITGHVHFGKIRVIRETFLKANLQLNTLCSPKEVIIEGDKCSNNWVITDREVMKGESLSEIWKFILEDTLPFQNATRLAEFVREKAPKDKISIDFVSHEETILHSTVHEMHEMLLSDLSDEMKIAVLKQIVNEISKTDKSIWNPVLSNCEKFQELLALIVNEIPGKEEEIEIWRYLKSLKLKCENIQFPCPPRFESLDDDNVPLEEEEYPALFVKDLNQLFDLINEGEFIRMAEKKSDVNITPSRYITTIFTRTVDKFLRDLKSKDCHAEFVFLIAALLPFGYNFRETVFETKMDQETLIVFSTQTRASLSTFEDMGNYSSKKQHAWVVRFLIVNLTKKISETSSISELPEEFEKNLIRLDKDVLDIIRKGTTLRQIVSMLSKELHDEENKFLCWFYLTDTLRKNITALHERGTRENVKLCTSVNISEELEYLIQIFELRSIFPEKLSVKKALEITKERFSIPETFQGIPLAMLHSIISCNIKYLEISYGKLKPHWLTSTLESNDSLSSSSSSSSEQDTVGDDYDDDNNVSDGDDDINAETLSIIHPLDSFFAVILCCDPFLRTLIYRKLALLKLALPLIHKDCNQDLSCSLMAMRKIFINDEAEPVATKCLSTVSFVRLGEVEFLSKSETVNGILREDYSTNSTFFHRNCKFGESQRKLYNGLIEIAWNIPKPSTSEENIEIFSKEFAVLNLRGDGLQFCTLFDLLLKLTNILVLFMDAVTLEHESSLLSKIQTEVRVVIIVTNKLENTVKSKQKKKTSKNGSSNLQTIYVKDAQGRAKNSMKIKEEIRKSIHKALVKVTNQIHLQNVIQNFGLHGLLKVDESLLGPINSPLQVSKFFSEMQSFVRDLKCKDDILPLQSRNLLHKWSLLNWELNQTGPLSSLSSDGNTEGEMFDIRDQQVKTCISTMDTVADFISILILQGSNLNGSMLFLSNIEDLLEAKSRAVLPEITRKLIKAFRSEAGNEEHNEIERMQEKLESANFTLLHFFRELGQIFESFHHSKYSTGHYIEQHTWYAIEFLPRIVAQLLIGGYTFEIMNGEAADISLNWVKAVFTELNSIESDKRIYSISVLGIQSSGKSTLLNAMFGLEFPVSSGRCTRGINLHLLRVSNPSLPFEYAFIFDTEGLRSSSEETSRTRNDNKLATLAIGIADTVILNVMGENIVDMENTLQIVVHALLRLKQANSKIELRQSCVFVHQNVCLTDKSFNLKPVIERTYRKLDKITKHIAEYEHMEFISSFSDVISFNTDHDVYYIPNLWHGEPPMAPISAAYSVEVGKLGKHILETCSERFQSFYNISDTYLRIESMWEGILSEDFVFSFQNIVQMKAYNLLQEHTNRLNWELEKFMNQFWRVNVQSELFKSALDDIGYVEARLKAKFFEEMSNLTRSKKENLKQFLNSSSLKREMIQWQESKLRTIEETSGVLKTRFNQKLSRQAMHHRIKCKHADMGTTEQILQKIAESAKSCKKEQLNETQREEKFNKTWQLLLSELGSELSPDTENDNIKQLQAGIYGVLTSVYEEHYNHLKKEWSSEFSDYSTKAKHLIMTVDENPVEYINIKPRAKMHVVDWLSSKLMTKCVQTALSHTTGIFKQIEDYFITEEEDDDDWEYDERDFKNHILPIVFDAFCTDNPKFEQFSLKKEYQIKIAVKAAKMACGRFSFLNKKFEEKHNLYAFVKARKLQAKEVFLNILQSEEEIVIVSTFLCGDIKAQITEYVNQTISEILKERVLEKFSFLKSNLINDILKDLVKKDTFEAFIPYIKDPEKFAKEWIKEQGIKLIMEQDKYGQTLYLKICLDLLSKEVSSIIESASLVYKKLKFCTLLQWVEEFHKNLIGFKIDDGWKSLIHSKSMTSAEPFYSVFLKKITAMEEDLQSLYKTKVDESDILNERNPFSHIFNTLWGCSHHCPMCFEPCENTAKDHFVKDNVSHSCINHRPFGLRGYFYKETKTLTIEICNFMVQNNTYVKCGTWCGCTDEKCTKYHNFHDHQKWIPEWKIPPKNSKSGSWFWCWFLAKYKSRLSSFYNVQEPVVPLSWMKITKSMALESLKRPMNEPLKETFLDKLREFIFRRR